MLKVIEGLIKILGSEALWRLLEILVSLLQKRGEVESGDELKITVYPVNVTNKVDKNKDNIL